MLLGIVALIRFISDRYFAELFNGDFSDHSQATDSASFLFQTIAVKISTLIFWAVCIVLSVYAYLKNFSLIPLLGLTSCLYLLTGMSASNWKWFSIWFAIGLVVYFMYGYRHSRLSATASTPA